MALVLTADAAAQPFAYVVGQRVPNGTVAVVSVIDTSTNARVATIPVGENCLCVNPDGIVVVPDRGRIYVTNEFAKTVSVIDIVSNSIVTTIASGDDPTAIVASPDGTRVYVLNGLGFTSVSAIDTATNTIVAITPLAVPQARGMAITPDGGRLYVSTYGSNSVRVIDTASMSVTTTIPVGELPLGVDVTPDGSHVYVAATASNVVFAIETNTNAVVASIPVGNRPQSARVTPDGTRVYVANLDSSTISIINTQTNTVVATVPNQNNPRTLDFSPDGARGYVATPGGVQVIDTTSNTVTAVIPFVAGTHGYPAAIVVGRAAGGNAPTAVSDKYATNMNTVLTVPAPGVLVNDTTAGGGAMTAALVSNVSQGTLVLNADGSFTFTPAPGFSGPVAFSYRAVNAVGQGNIATVVLAVVTGPQPPSSLYVSSVVGNSVTLRWMPPTVGDAPTGYVLEGGLARAEVLASLLTNSTAGTFTFVAPSGTFFIRMHTLSGPNRSTASNEIPLFVNAPVAPSAPTNLLSVVNGDTLSLAWRNTFEGGAQTGLLLHVSGSVTATLLLPPLANGVTVSGVPAGTYTLSLRAANAVGFSGPSNLITVTLPGGCSGVPGIPANVMMARDGGLVTALWDRATSGPATTGFVVNVSGSYVGTFQTTRPVLSGVVGPGTYTVTVSGTNPCGMSSPTTPQTVVVP